MEVEKKGSFIRKNIGTIIFVLSFIVFGVIAVLMHFNKLASIDNFIYHYVSYLICGPLTIIFRIITEFGDKYVLLSLIILTFILFKNKKYGIMLFIDLGLAAGINHFIKDIFVRPRPIGINLINETGYSFPSGHSVASMAFYGLAMYLIYKSNLKQNVKKILYWLLSILIFLIGLSRIYLGAHYFTDVIGGFSFGICLLVIFIKIIYPLINKIKIKRIL